MTPKSTVQHAMANAVAHSADVVHFMGSELERVDTWLPLALEQIPAGFPRAHLYPGSVKALDVMGHLMAAKAALKDGLLPPNTTKQELNVAEVEPLSQAIHTETLYHMLRMALLASESSSMLADLEALQVDLSISVEDFLP